MNKEEFSKFYNQNINRVYRYIFLKVNSKEIAQDITSEAFLKFLDYLKNETEIKNSRAFLYQVVRNLIVDFYRSKSREPLPLDEIFVRTDRGQRPDVRLERASDVAKMKRVLGQIKRKYADIIIWHYLDDLSIPEIAEMTQRPEGTVRVMLHRGLRELRKRMES